MWPLLLTAGRTWRGVSHTPCAAEKHVCVRSGQMVFRCLAFFVRPAAGGNVGKRTQLDASIHGVALFART